MADLTGKIQKVFTSNKILFSILIITFIVRLPSLFEPLWYGDEAIYLTIGQNINRGLLLYVDIFDHKTPGIYYLAAWAIKFLGSSIWSFRFLLMIWVLTTLVVFYLLANRMFDRKIALGATAILAALTSTPLLEGNIVNSEILMILPTSLAILFGLNKRYFVSGLFFSLSILLKFPAVFDLAAFLIFIALTVQKDSTKETVKNLLLIMAGVVFPIFLTVIYFTSKGALWAYFNSAFLFNIAYTSYKNHYIIENGLLIVKAIPAIAVTIYFFARLLKRLRAKKESSFSLYEFLIIWLIFSFYSAVFGGRPYEHYLIQTIPAFSLTLAVSLFRKDFAKVGIFTVVIIITAALALGFRSGFKNNYYGNFFGYLTGKLTFDQYSNSLDPKAARNHAVAAFLRGCEEYNKQGRCEKFRTKAGENLYVYGNQPSIYFLSDLVPATKFIVFFHIAGNQKLKDEAYQEIKSSKPNYILIDNMAPGSFASLEKMVIDEYNLVAFYEDLAIYKHNEDKKTTTF